MTAIISKGVHFDSKESATELTVECLQEMKREKYNEEFRLIMLNMEKKSVWFELFESLAEMDNYIQGFINKQPWVFAYLVLPSTADGDVEYWTKGCYGHYYRQIGVANYN